MGVVYVRIGVVYGQTRRNTKKGAELTKKDMESATHGHMSNDKTCRGADTCRGARRGFGEIGDLQEGGICVHKQTQSQST